MSHIAIGRILSTRGLRGELRFKYYNESESGLSQYAALYAERYGAYVELTPSRVQPQRGCFMIQFRDIATSGEAAFLVGKELFVREEDLPSLSEGEYYDYQLVGLTAINEQHEPIGKVKEVIHTKANDIIVIGGQTDILVPMLEDFILSVDISASFIRVAEGALVG